MNRKYSLTTLGLLAGLLALLTACSSPDSDTNVKKATTFFTGPEFTPELAGIWEGTTTDSVTEASAEAFLFTNDDGRLILASRLAISAEGTATLERKRLQGEVVAATPEGHTFADGNVTAACAFSAAFRTQMDIEGSYTCPDGTTGAFEVTRISPLASELATTTTP